MTTVRLLTRVYWLMMTEEYTCIADSWDLTCVNLTGTICMKSWMEVIRRTLFRLRRRRMDFLKPVPHEK